MECIKETYFERWEDFTNMFNTYKPESKKFIFRGQSNESLDGGKFNKWDLISAFNRNQKRYGYSFNTYLSQHLDPYLFKSTYGKYSLKNIDALTKASILQKCYYFQHYGIPTCFLDFTFDPNIALYFALTSLPGRSGGAYDIEGNPKFYSNEPVRDFISVYQIDVNNLINALKLKHINEDDFNYLSIDTYKISSTISSYLAIDLSPTASSNKSLYNSNLDRQKGCFLYYDNEDSGIPLEKFIDYYITFNAINIKEPIINIYNINYNSLFKKLRSRNPNHVPLFSFLRSKKVIGEYLFNDLQGLKYDFNFFHQE